MALMDDFAPLVAHLGEEGFDTALMRVLRHQCGADMCSVFVLADGSPGVLVAESHDPSASPFARIASLRYAQRYWRRDTAALSTLGRAHRRVQLLQRTARVIRDLDYQHECYTAGAVTERLSLYRHGSPAIIANAYRLRESGAFGAAHVDAFAEMATLLHATLEKHARLTQRPASAPRPDMIARDLEERSNLSHREAQVAAFTLAGFSQSEIAARLGFAPSSVVTYRKRAYAKLGVANRVQLREYFAPSTDVVGGGKTRT